ncbi:phage major capsid protein [Pusillimonas sp. ANT_WB101]|uniref:phage major capsid protein n=1 Tax=Pusillimonas sp. ANT_WB101 TaxID=2597356 RepID=UPI0011ED81C2|nr:phage major capsid protein [Pusillimonas sp. ANT_WB101]KAA0893068.1 phage major capsid protein [Pusillimonas sp. ANT_WB101]
MNINAIKEARASKVHEMRGLLNTAETEKRSLNDGEKTAFDKLKAEITGLEADEQRASFMAEAERQQHGEPVGDKSLQSLEARINVMDVLRAQMENRSVDGPAREYSQEVERRTGRKAEGCFVPMGLLEQRVNTTTTASDIVPTIHRPDQYIGALREQLVARQLGVRVLTGLSGNLSIPKYGTGLTTGWIAENSPVPDGSMTFDSVSLTPKHVGGKTEMSRQLIQQSSPDIEQLVRDDLAFLIAKQIDRAIIAGTGTGNEPMGVINVPGIQTASLADLDWASVMAMVQKLEDEEIAGGTWLTTGTVKTLLGTTLKEAGLAGYLLEGGRMAERALRVTRHMTGGNVLLGDFSQVLLGVWSEFDLLVNPFAEPAYSRGGVQVRAMATVGTAIRHEQAFVLANDVEVG